MEVSNGKRRETAGRETELIPAMKEEEEEREEERRRRTRGEGMIRGKVTKEKVGKKA